ncbi:MAG TPA: 6-phosphogluconolactonase [Ferruginibacter sp.]|nr:6-phosphogluconolactonase [Ferruginibacter sp.]
MTKIVVFRDEDSLSKAAAELIVDISKHAIRESGKFTIALSGGKTPSKLFSMLAEKPFNKEINWKQTYVFWGDERFVAANNSQNNSYVAKKILLDNIPVPAENIFPIPVNIPPAASANHYEQTLKAFFRSDNPSFDLILLGMGDDGHTASLFPGSTVLSEKAALVKEVYLEEQQVARITFTVPLINNAKHILFLVTGKEKAGMLFKVLEGKARPGKYPAKMIRAGKGKKIYWYADKAAASLIN